MLVEFDPFIRYTVWWADRSTRRALERLRHEAASVVGRGDLHAAGTRASDLPAGEATSG